MQYIYYAIKSKYKFSLEILDKIFAFFLKLAYISHKQTAIITHSIFFIIVKDLFQKVYDLYQDFILEITILYNAKCF